MASIRRGRFVGWCPIIMHAHLPWTPGTSGKTFRRRVRAVRRGSACTFSTMGGRPRRRVWTYYNGVERGTAAATTASGRSNDDGWRALRLSGTDGQWIRFRAARYSQGATSSSSGTLVRRRKLTHGRHGCTSYAVNSAPKIFSIIMFRNIYGCRVEKLTKKP